MLLVSDCYLVFRDFVVLKKLIDFLKYSRWCVVDYRGVCERILKIEGELVFVWFESCIFVIDIFRFFWRDRVFFFS